MKFALFLLCLCAVPFAAHATPYDKDLTGYEYPYPVSYYDFRAQDQDMRMAFMDVKPEGKANGRTVILLHGKNFAANYWDSTIKGLVAEGYRVIAPDQIGFGKSTKPDNLQYSFHALGEWTHDLVRRQGVKKFSVVGHSMGGMLAVRMALLFPDEVEKLALVNPIGLEDYRTLAPYTSIDQWYAQEQKASVDGLRKYQKDVYFHGQWKPEYDKLIEIPAGWMEGPDRDLIARNSAKQYDMIYTQPVVYEFRNLQLPTLLLIGTKDRTAINKDKIENAAIKDKVGRYDFLGRTTEDRIFDSRLVEFAGAGHLPQIEVFDEYIESLKDFLNHR